VYRQVDHLLSRSYYAVGVVGPDPCYTWQSFAIIPVTDSIE
jgi:hypothetical protein